MNHQIYIQGNDSLTLKPEDGAVQGVVNHLISAADRRLYAYIRAYGYSTRDAAIAAFGAFGKVLLAHVDALTDFAAAYETTRGYQIEYADVCEQIGEKRLKLEWAKRSEELSIATCDAAMSLRLSLNDYKPQVNEFQSRKDEAAWKTVAAKRAEELSEAKREVIHDLPTQGKTHGHTTLYGHDYEENDFWHGMRANGQVGSPVEYDPNAQKPVFQE